MIGLPTSASSRISSRLMPGLIASWATSPLSAFRTARVISPAPSGWSIAYETRLIRSSPKRICGFITPWLARTAPSARSARWPAIVVEPTSIATPYARSWRPGQTAVTVRPSWTATVTAVRARLERRLERRGPPARSASRSVRPHSRSSASKSRARSPAGDASSGGVDLDVVEPDDRVDLEVADVEALADDLAMDLALGRDVDDGVAAEVRPCRTAGARRRGPCRRGTSLSTAPNGDRCSGRGLDPVLRERADALLDLAAAADPAPAADRVDVDAERPGRVEDRGPVGEPAAPPGRREDDERLGRRGHRPGSDRAGRSGAAAVHPPAPLALGRGDRGTRGSSGSRPGRCP